MQQSNLFRPFLCTCRYNTKMQNFFTLKSKNVGNGDTVSNELEDGNKCCAPSCDDPSIPLLWKGKAEQTGLWKRVVHILFISLMWTKTVLLFNHMQEFLLGYLTIQQLDCQMKKTQPNLFFFFHILKISCFARWQFCSLFISCSVMSYNTVK